MEYFVPAILLFAAQSALCLLCKNNFLRLVPTFIALCIAVYHTSIIVASLDNLWVAGFAFAYLLPTAMLPLAAVGLGWITCVVKLMIREVKELKQ